MLHKLLTVLFDGSLCNQRSGTGHVRLDGDGLLRWLHAEETLRCERNDYGRDFDATIVASNARQVATGVLVQLGLGPNPSKTEIDRVIASRPDVIIL
jgi:hypothetical protein